MKKEHSNKNNPSNNNPSSTYAYYKSIADDVITLQIMDIIEGNPETSHGKITSKTGLAAGLVHSFMSRIAKKGWIRAKQVSPKRWLYFMTPEGFLEKSRLTVSYLSHTLRSYRLTQEVVQVFLANCEERNLRKIAVIGSNDVADVAALVISSATGFQLSAVVASGAEQKVIGGMAVLSYDRLSEVNFDIVCVCDPEFYQEPYREILEARGISLLNLFELIRIRGSGAR